MPASNVVVHYRESAAEAQELRAELVARGAKAWLVKADFDDADAPARLISEALDAAGSLDILVNSASLFLPSTIQDMDFAGLTRMMQVNAWAPLALSREFARRVGRGKIVNLLDSRIAGFDAAHVAYILSKRALSVLTEMMALEFAPDITVNGVGPGLILPPPGKDEAYLDELAKGLPLKRHGNPGRRRRRGAVSAQKRLRDRPGHLRGRRPAPYGAGPWTGSSLLIFAPAALSA